MLRRALLLGLFVGGFAGPIPFVAADTSSIELKQMLEKGLKARRTSEFEFITSVIAKVESGELPESVVRATFLWARNQPVNTFQYFQFGIRERAKKYGVTF